MTKPLIGIVSNHNDKKCPRQKAYRLLDNVVHAVERAGGLALILPYELEAIPQVLETVDGIVFPGGDISYGTEFYVPGEKPTYKPSKRAAYEVTLLRHALSIDMPVLGLCLGMQILGCMLGGKLQCLPKPLGIFRSPHRCENGNKLVHPVFIKENTLLHKLTDVTEMMVNSIHAEHVTGLDEQYISARAPDGVIEAIEMPDKKFVMGVLWHPEYFLQDGSLHLNVLKGFIAAAKK
jgi:putative glutamine amidotransferase